MARRIVIVLALIVTVASLSSAQNSSLAWKRFQHLQHGVALSGWFSESGNYSLQQLRAATTPADLEHIHKLGFDHIRIPVDPVIFQCEGAWESCERIAFLDQVIQQAISFDLDVILDFHPNPQYTHLLLSNAQAADKYLRLWAQIADHYGAMDQDRIILEVMNEISSPDLNSWLGLLQQSIEVIRHHAPNSTIIVQGAGYSDIWDLIRVPALPDNNLIYNFHYYEPHIFTHQGATWGLDYWLDVKNLPFPPTEKGVSEAIEHADSEEARWRLLQYKSDHWDAGRIASDIEFAAQWAHERNVPLMCDEFGVYRNFSPPDSREHWLTAARTAFEKNHIGWTMWDYQGGFGVVYKDKGATRDDDVVLHSLGLRK
ncbi:MAG: cellulase family glycosylhydrolase [Terracidiphilus sp.]